MAYIITDIPAKSRVSKSVLSCMPKLKKLNPIEKSIIDNMGFNQFDVTVDSKSHQLCTKEQAEAFKNQIFIKPDLWGYTGFINELR